MHARWRVWLLKLIFVWFIAIIDDDIFLRGNENFINDHHFAPQKTKKKGIRIKAIKNKKKIVNRKSSNSKSRKSSSNSNSKMMVAQTTMVTATKQRIMKRRRK